MAATEAMILDQQANAGYSSVPRSTAATNYPTTIEPLAPGTSGTFQALDAMAQAVRGEVPPDYSGYRDPGVREIAGMITAGASGNRARVERVFTYVIACIQYLDHPPNAQVVQDALRTILIGSGDCVSMSVLLATLLAALDLTPRFVAQFTGDVEGYSHVYVEADLDGRWLALDPVAKDKPMGWSQPLPDGGFETSHEIFR